MKHQSTRAVFEYWTRKRGTRTAPARADIDPAEIRHALGDTFILAADFAGELRLRLAGTRVCALFDRELKCETFSGLWSAESRPSIDELLAGVTDEAAGVVAGATARTDDGATAELEMLLLPLAGAGHARVRAMGVLAPRVPPWWLGAKPAAELTLGTLRHTGIDDDIGLAPRLIAGALGSRVRHGFVVYSGGRETPPGERTG
jgi:hypothetical protein